MTDFRRSSLQRVPLSESTHPGLWLERWLLSDEPEGRINLFEETVNIDIGDSPLYKEAFSNWCRSMTDETRFTQQPVRATSRIAVGLGAESVLETSLAIHRTYGVPYLPGSALKGLARHFCLHQYGAWPGNLDKSDDNYAFRLECRPSAFLSKEQKIELQDTPYSYFDLIFGMQDLAGGLIFHDALMIPNLVKNPLQSDVMTVHHGDYYGAKGSGNDIAPPADWDDPNPVSYVDVRAGVSFLLVIEGATTEWRKMALDILLEALKIDGIGAKTATGYGRLEEATCNDIIRTLDTVCKEPKPYDEGEIWNKLKEMVPDKENQLMNMYLAIEQMKEPEKWYFAAVLLSNWSNKYKKWLNKGAQKVEYYNNLQKWAASVSDS